MIIVERGSYLWRWRVAGGSLSNGWYRSSDAALSDARGTVGPLPALIYTARPRP